jgi:hypothetical protein
MLNVKVKVKIVPVLNQPPRHEDVLGSGGIVPRILDFGTNGGEWSALPPRKETPVPIG